jgi:hypothetical protein
MILGIFWTLIDAASYFLGILGIDIGRRDDAQIKRDVRDAFAESKEGQQIERLRREVEEIKKKLKKDQERAQKEIDDHSKE